MAKNGKDRSQKPEVRSQNENASLLASRFSLLTSAFVLLLVPQAGFAHPMGNFSISHYAGIRIERDFVELRYLIDMAEIPTFQEIQQTGIVPRVGDRSLSGYLEREAEALKAGLALDVNGRPLFLEVVSSEVIFPPGAGGLATMKLGFLYRARLDGLKAAELNELHYRDRNFGDRVGWKEVIAVAGQGIRITSSSVPESDRSQQLANYPTDLLNSPPQALEAEASFEVLGGETGTGNSKLEIRNSKLGSESSVSRLPILDSRSPRADSRAPRPEPQTPTPESVTPNGGRLIPNQQATPRNRFTELIATKQFGFWFLFTAALVAAGLGALHALEPGHGKTIVAAYLVGSGGTAAHACLLGLIVTASHTAGVYLLGAVTLYASRYVVPEQLYPWLGAVSGLIIAGLGVFLFLRRYDGETNGDSHAHGHSHFHSHAHTHGHDAGQTQDHHHQGPQHEGARSGAEEPHAQVHERHSHGCELDHHHRADLHHPDPGGRVSWRQLLALGVTGGMVPCPAALVVLLSAVALHRIAFGLFLIAAFSVGLAAVLISIGLLMVYAGQFVSRLHGDGPLMTRWLPLASAAVITALGLAIAVRALVAAGILQVRL